ncbi:acid phosphatase [Gloeomargarita lithophora Alchichica-D10]|uniref:5'-nucleotidase n=1 Tax=Gloeomargarita lithophora Alchichica-D10 TaxID=1188229 RepID=A0A1J0A9C4_9CYAN|nr:5'/3'-nucleotidase SurE [Gloeomargarita lithophora]APB32544.1 acid phosphatase [Gloeomargarita lithophora Alchichica-D10]
MTAVGLTNILLTNDDGIDAPGLQVLAQVLPGALVVAPQAQFSGCGHRITTGRPILFEQRTSHRYAVQGTPVDCVRLTLAHWQPDTAWVLAGVNQGANLGVDVYQSGTVAAVREAALHRIPAIALSQYQQRGTEIDWQRTQRWSEKVLQILFQKPAPGCFWNVNFPHLEPTAPEPELVFCPPCTQPLPMQYQATPQGFVYQGVYQQRPYDPAADVAVCFRGHIAISQMGLG